MYKIRIPKPYQTLTVGPEHVQNRAPGQFTINDKIQAQFKGAWRDAVVEGLINQAAGVAIRVKILKPYQMLTVGAHAIRWRLKVCKAKVSMTTNTVNGISTTTTSVTAFAPPGAVANEDVQINLPDGRTVTCKLPPAALAPGASFQINL